MGSLRRASGEHSTCPMPVGKGTRRRIISKGQMQPELLDNLGGGLDDPTVDGSQQDRPLLIGESLTLLPLDVAVVTQDFEVSCCVEHILLRLWSGPVRGL